jgi:uncharacterized membrane protein YeaQ/YmgE (transglycosylase-associated protein family)
MTGKNTAVFGIYPNANQAEHTVDRLIASGFASDDISVLLPDNKSSKDFAHEKNTKAPEGTTTGVTAGGAIGGTLGLLAGIGALAIPGLGPFIAAGPIMGALAGLGVGWAFPNTKRSDTKDGSKKVAFFCRFIATLPRRSRARRTCSSKLELKTSLRVAKLAPTIQPPTRLATQFDSRRKPSGSAFHTALPEGSMPRKKDTMSILAWIVLGLIAGFIGSKLVNKSGEGVLLDIILGIVGAVIGGWVFQFFGAAGVTGLNLYSLLVAVIGSVLFLVVYHALRRAS